MINVSCWKKKKKTKLCQLRILYPEILSFSNEGEIKTSTKAKKFFSTRPTLEEMLVLQAEMKRCLLVIGKHENIWHTLRKRQVYNIVIMMCQSLTSSTEVKEKNIKNR